MIGKFLYSLALLLVAFVVGTAGGIWAQAFLLPFMSTHDPYQNWGFVQEWKEQRIVVQNVTQFVIGEREGLEKVAEDAKKVVVAIESTRANTSVAGSGLLYSREGLIITTAAVVPPGYTPSVFRGENISLKKEAKVLKRDTQHNLVLLAIEENDLPTASFQAVQKTGPGASVFAVGKRKISQQQELKIIFNEGIVKSSENGKLQTTMQDDLLPLGSVIFALSGEVVGLAEVTTVGDVSIIPTETLRGFLAAK